MTPSCRVPPWDSRTVLGFSHPPRADRPRVDDDERSPVKRVQVTGPDTIEWVEVEQPSPGPHDVLLAMRACGICGSDAFYAHMGGIPPRQGATPLGHEPAAEVVEVGA